MKESTALKIRKFLPKSYIEKVEKVIVKAGDIVQNFENGLISEDIAQLQLSDLMKKAIKRHLIAPQSVQEILDVAMNDKLTIEYLKNKHGDQ